MNQREPICTECDLADDLHARVGLVLRNERPGPAGARELLERAARERSPRLVPARRAAVLAVAAAVLLAAVLAWRLGGEDAPPAAPHADTAAWQVLGIVGPVRVELARAVYAAPDERVTVRIRITNTGERPLGLDLRECIFPVATAVGRARRYPIHPNASAAGAPHLSPDETAALRAALSAGTLTPLAPGASLEYFPQRRTDRRTRIDRQRGTHLQVFLAGRLLVTDGDAVYLPSCSSDGGQLDDWLRLARPWTWKPLPAGARLVR